MSVSYVEREQADATTKVFYDKSEERFEMLLNIFKVFGHTPELGTVFTDTVMAMLKDGELDWVSKELLILKATHRNECQYCVVQHETLGKRLGISEEKIGDIAGDRYKTSPHFTAAEKTLLDLTVQICAGVGYAHRAGLVHCDVKPQNVIVTHDDQIKVADFGIARAMSEASQQIQDEGLPLEQIEKVLGAKLTSVGGVTR